MIRPAAKAQLHARNRFRAGYDFPRLIAGSPRLSRFVAPNAYGDLSIDYANPAAVKALNQALLKDAYGIDWDIPTGYLCPPIPGRSDYLHHLADFPGIGAVRAPRRLRVRVLDIGTGANCIYPLIGATEYGWRFVATEIDRAALQWAKQLVSANPAVADLIECRLQTSPLACFDGVTGPGEVFDLSMCNPPFHASAAAAAAGNRRKQRNLAPARSRTSTLNFGGQAGELWCQGGELAFVRRMITESASRPRLCRWFTTLVSTSAHLPALVHALEAANVLDVRIVEMAQGQKKSRILAWTFTRS